MKANYCNKTIEIINSTVVAPLMFSKLAYPLHWILPGLTWRDGSTLTGFRWNEKIPPIVILPSFENCENSWAPYGRQTGFPRPENKTSNKMSVSSSMSENGCVLTWQCPVVLQHRLKDLYRTMLRTIVRRLTWGVSVPPSDSACM